MRKHVTIDITTGETKIEEVPAYLRDLEPAAQLEALMQDCPECREARARGEVPEVIVPGSQPVKRDLIRDRRPRWRDLKRSARR